MKYKILIVLFIVVLFGCSKKENKVEPKPEDKIKKIEFIKHEVQKGESIYQILSGMGISNQDIAEYTLFLGDYIEFTNIQIQDSIKVSFREKTVFDTTIVQDSIVVSENKIKVLDKFIYKPNIIYTHILHNYDDSLSYELQTLPFVSKKRIVTGEVESNLTNALAKLGFSKSERQQVIKPLESTISFVTDARKGDKFKILIDEKFYNGKKLVPLSRIYYASYEGKHVKKREGFKFLDKNIDSSFNGMFTPEGKVLVTGAVRTPLNRMHISSPFGKRIHPISHKWKMHHGIDLRGNYSTPVFAVSNGKVIQANNSGDGYGKQIRIKHIEMTTQYAHLSKMFVKRGQRVRKGQKIGMVGSTGYSTGPHLHFGLKKNGRWINPKRLNMVGAFKLSGNRFTMFKTQMKNIINEMDFIENPPVNPETY